MQVVVNWRFRPDPSNFTSYTPLLVPAAITADVCPTIATGTFMVKAKEHSQVWMPKTSGLAATSWPMSQMEKVTLSRSELGMRLSKASNLWEKCRFLISL